MSDNSSTGPCLACRLDVFTFSDVRNDVLRSVRNTSGYMDKIIFREMFTSLMDHLEGYMENEDLVFARQDGRA